MALNYITPVPDLTDGTGTPLAAGQPPLNPPAQLTAASSSYANGTPATTMRHDRARQNLDRYPNYNRPPA